MGYSNASGDPIDELFELLRQFGLRLAELERPTGSQTAQALKTLQDLVDGLLTQINGVFSGFVSAGSTMTAVGNVTSSSGFLVSPAGPTFDITTGRTAAWWRNSDGLLAFASSSREKKTNIRDSDVDPLAVLDWAIRAFNYRAEVAKRDDPTYPEYEGPDYHVALEFGGIAEEAHELGLWQVVIYQDHWKPIGIHYELVGMLAVRATQHVWQTLRAERAERLALARRVEALEILLGVQGL